MEKKGIILSEHSESKELFEATMNKRIVQILAVALIQLICIAQFECAFVAQAEQAPELLSWQAGIAGATGSYAFIIKSDDVFKQTASYKNSVVLLQDNNRTTANRIDWRTIVVKSFASLLKPDQQTFILKVTESAEYAQLVVDGIASRAPPAIGHIASIMPNC